jgi:amino acid adenylation domain-containing protein/non-ribosomal peptide synthase protein (TIGR01720 family)
MASQPVKGYRVSPQQRRLWLLAQQSPSAYRLCASLDLAGALDATALRRALLRVASRHEALRTSFARRPGMRFPLQVVGGSAEVTWRESDLTALEAGERDTRLAEVREMERGEEFASGAGLRGHLVKLAESRHRLEVSASVLCADSESLRTVARELAACYAEALGGTPLDGEPLQYADFSNWQSELLESEEAAEGREYWRRVAGEESLTLPFERVVSGPTVFAPERVRVGEWDGGMLDAVSAGGAEAGWLLACWQTLLWRLGGGEGLPPIAERVGGRKYEELAGGVGPYAKWLPVAGGAARGLSFRELVARVEDSRRSNAVWEQYFIAEAAEDEEGARASAPVGFEYATVGEEFESAGVRFSIAEQYASTETFKLKLSCARRGRLLLVELDYDANVYGRDTAGRIAENFAALLDGTLETPGAPLDELRILRDEERRRLLRDLNRSRAAYPSGRCFHQLFEEQAERTPERVAVVCGGRQLTYAELNAAANRLAHALRRRGVSADVRVGLCLERSVETIIGVLAIMKAGGAYVPLSEEYPQERLRHQLSEIESPVLLTQEKFLGLLPEFSGDTLCLDRDRALFEAEPAVNPETVNAPDNLAYVIYTSGSTGRPKGVAVTHRSLVNYATFVSRDLCAAAEEAEPLHFATVSTIAADLGHTAIFPALASGGCLHLLSYEVATDAHAFAEYLARHPVDVLKIVPSHLGALLTSDEGARALPRRFLVLGGEALPPSLLGRVEALAPGCRVINHYGPTETTVGALVNARPGAADRGEGVVTSLPASVPIGRPLANAEAYVLDAHLRPQPCGVVGELYLGGHGLARGYLRQPAQTAERFVPHPFAEESGARLYRTGDLARVWPDGDIEFVGRADDQVKIRGFRIELGEIEAALRRHAGVSGAIVLAREDEPGHKRLAAYVEAEARHALSAGQLQEHVRTCLPEYMVPAAFVILERLPLTSNGKVDRRALPEPEQAVAASGQAYVAPRTEVERALARIWQEVLRVERVGVNDNFFAYGGDSILSIQIVARARRAGLHLTPKQLFQYQTIGELAPFVTTTTAPTAEQGTVEGDVPLTPIQRWFFEQRLEDPNHFNQAMLLEVPREATAPLLRQALASLLEHHDALRLRFEQAGSEWRQHHAAPDGEVPFAEVDLSGVAEGEQPAALEAEASGRQRSLHLGDGPLVRAVLFEMGGARANRLLIVVHHLVVDGVSWRVLLEDLQLACEQLRRGERVALPPKTTSFKEWAERLSNYARSAEVTAEAAYWTEATTGTGAGLPLDTPGGDNSRAAAGSLTVELDRDETAAVLKELPAVYRTEINDTLLTALALAVGAWAGRRTLFVEMEGHGREEIDSGADITRTVGWFTTHYPVRLSFEDGADPLGVLKSVKETLRAVPRRGIGYGLLRRLRGDDEAARRLCEAPRPEIKFNYLGQMDQTLDTADGFAPARESYGETQSASGARSHLFEINAGVLGGRLFLRWVYGAQLHRRETVERLAATCLAQLRALVGLCRSPATHACTPADFPAAQLGRKELDRFMTTLGEGRVRSVEDIYRLSPMQEGMLFHSLMATDADIYYRQLSCSLHGPLNIVAFERAWQRVIDEHPVLRTSFHWHGLESPVQVVNRATKLPLTYEDWRDVPAGGQAARLEALIASEHVRKFELTEAPLMRLVLVRLSEDVHHFVWSYHHLLMDGWAKHEVFNEILALYRAYDAGRELTLLSRRPYREYIGWLQRQDMQEAESFWRRTLKGYARATALDGAGAARGAGAPPRPKAHFDKLQTFLPADTTARLYDFARRHHLTLNTTVVGAWGLLLGHDGGHSDVVFGAVMSGRPPALEGAEQIIGMFINTLPVRVRTEAEEEGVIEWLRRIQEQQAELRQYEYSPLVQVQGWSEMPRGGNLFESLLSFENYPIDTAARAEHTTVEVRDYRVLENNNYPLTLMVGPAATLSLLLIYDRERFPTARAEAIQARLAALLAAFADADAESSLRDVRQRAEAAVKEREALRGEELKGLSLQTLKAVKRRAVRGTVSTTDEAP